MGELLSPSPLTPRICLLGNQNQELELELETRDSNVGQEHLNQHFTHEAKC